MRNANAIPTLRSIYNSMTKADKINFRKSYMLEFDISSQTFDRRRDSDFTTLTPAERRWASEFLNKTIEELFTVTVNE